MPAIPDAVRGRPDSGVVFMPGDEYAAYLGLGSGVSMFSIRRLWVALPFAGMVRV